MNLEIFFLTMSSTLIGLLIGFVVGHSTTDPKTSEAYKSLYSDFLKLQTQADAYYRQYMALVCQDWDRVHTKVIRECPAGTLDAVKLAMKISHPDNGGNNEDFIKYRQVYLKLTGKEKW